jgi:lysophospholipase L1-like esterase
MGGITKMVVIPSASYPSVLLGLLRTRYTAQANSITMVNSGLSGEKARNPDTLLRFANVVANNRPDVVVIAHGYNDASDGSVLTATVEAIDAMMAEARNRRVGRVFTLNMAPSRPGGNNSLPLTSVQAFNERLERAVRGEGAVYVDIYSALLPDVNTYMGRDGLHPTEAGYRKIAETLLTAIRNTLEVR